MFKAFTIVFFIFANDAFALKPKIRRRKISSNKIQTQNKKQVVHQKVEQDKNRRELIRRKRKALVNGSLRKHAK